MVDIPGDNTTTTTVTVGSTTAGTLESFGDHDWYRIQLSAGQSISVAINGVTLIDPYLRIRDSAGTVLYENDDISAGVIRNSLLGFTATSSGTYFIDVGGFDDEYAGDFNLVISNYSPPPVGTVDQFANQLTTGYWGGDLHHFNVAQGGTISVNLTGLTAAGQNLAREALALWSDVIGVTFTQVGSGGQINFDDNEAGAHSSGIWSGGIISSADVNVSTQWLADYGTSLNSYSFQTYIHEIGHALGLGHAGNYNDTARYPFEARYSNDGWPMTVMSYFDQRESSHYASLGFTVGDVVTPMIADVVAMSQLYGLSTTTRAGDTTYGFNSNAGRGVFDATVYSEVSYTVFDSGGVDTLDYSGFAQSQLIDLTSGVFSNVGGRTGNVTIAIGTLIENAIGGSGDDTIRGNGADNLLVGNGGNDRIFGFEGNDTFISGPGDDTFAGGNGIDTVSYANALAGIFVDRELVGSVNNAAGFGNDGVTEVEIIIGSAFNDTFFGTNLPQRFEGGAGADTFGGQGGDDTFVGGAGADIFRDTLDGLNRDTIVDFSADDRLIFADATLGSFAFSLSGTTLSYSGGSLNFGSILPTELTARGLPGGVGVELTLSRPLFGGATLAFAGFGASPAAGGWSSDDRYPRMLADVNGDGRADIIGFGEQGAYISLATSSGAFAAATLATTGFGAGVNAGGWSSNDVYVRQMADINGDGRADIVGFGNGGVYVALSTSEGSFGAVTLATTAYGAAESAGGWTSNDRYLRLVADVNGDGKADIVGFGIAGVYVSLATAAGSFAAPTLATTAFGAGPDAGGWSSNDLYLRQLADVNGDGRADIVGFGNAGVYVGLANANGTFAAPALGLREFGAGPGAGGWASDDRFPRELGDVNGDHKIDVVGFGNGGVYIALGRGDGSFDASTRDLKFYGAQPAAGGWASDDLYPRHLADVNHDGAADIVGFASTGVYVSLSTVDLLT